MHTNSDICSMHILIMAATGLEIEPTIDYLNKNGYTLKDHTLDLLVSGVGLLSSSYALTSRIMNHKPGLVIQAGIAGSFSEEYPPGRSVLVIEEVLGDCGVSEEGVFKDIFDLNLSGVNSAPFTGKKLVNPAYQRWKTVGLPLATGVTVNEITTDLKRIAQLKEKYNAGTESMEGAVLHYVCLQEKVPFVQLRCVSNYVGERDKSKWKMKEAITELNKSLITFIQQL